MLTRAGSEEKYTRRRRRRARSRSRIKEEEEEEEEDLGVARMTNGAKEEEWRVTGTAGFLASLRRVPAEFPT
ncbi:hypothetical protein E2C01_066239 [Portunus trituberculatus]|uniref:Uncharacterized protein n=1 Tax=Portunus trituberculatus TaxID=210409 RepID=A0A5B7HRS5_PORTR|nr:hypothetical protein [Portunus trituberculatus]